MARSANKTIASIHSEWRTDHIKNAFMANYGVSFTDFCKIRRVICI